MEGYIKSHRKILKWEWYDEPNTFRVFMHFLLKANHTEKSWRGIKIKRGTYLTSISKIAQETKLSVRNVRTSIKRLKSTGEVTSHPTAQYTVISVVNYDSYQQSDKLSGKQATNKRQTSDKRVTTTKNEKNEKNDKNINIINNKDSRNPNVEKVKQIVFEAFEWHLISKYNKDRQIYNNIYQIMDKYKKNGDIKVGREWLGDDWQQNLINAMNAIHDKNPQIFKGMQFLESLYSQLKSWLMNNGKV